MTLSSAFRYPPKKGQNVRERDVGLTIQKGSKGFAAASASTETYDKFFWI